MKWAIELGEYDIQYSPRTAIKAQALSDFLVEFTSRVEAGQEWREPRKAVVLPDSGLMWNLFMDGASGQSGSGAGLVLIDPECNSFTYAIRLLFPATNNQSEYETLMVAGLKLAMELKVRVLRVYSDSQLVVSQLKGEFEARKSMLHKYLKIVRHLAELFEKSEIIRVLRTQFRMTLTHPHTSNSTLTFPFVTISHTSRPFNFHQHLQRVPHNFRQPPSSSAMAAPTPAEVRLPSIF